MTIFRYILIAALIYILSSCNQSTHDKTAANASDDIFIQDQLAKNELDSLHIYFEKELPEWVKSFSNFTLADFKKTDTLLFDNNYKQDFKQLHPFLAIYKPIITFSKDSTKFIDIYSYQLNLEKKGKVYQANIDVDQAIFLFDKRSGYWDRIFFGTPGGWIDDVIWITDSIFILVGVKKNEASNNAPMILLGNFETQSLIIFENNNNSCVQRDSGYRSPNLKALNIQGL